MKIQTLVGVALLLGSTGCAIEPGQGADSEPVGQAQAAFIGSINGNLDANTAVASGSMGNHSYYTNFLWGVSGNLDYVDYYAPAASVDTGGVVGGYNQLVVTPEYHTANTVLLGGWAGAVYSTTNRTSPVGATSPGATSVTLGAVTSKRRCFLNSISNPFSDLDYPVGGFFYEYSDYVYINNDGANWHLNATGETAATASCIDVTTYLGQAGWAWGGADNDVDLGADQAGKFCFLYGIGGKFRANDWSNGVFIKQDANHHWWMHVSGGLYGAAECDI